MRGASFQTYNRQVKKNKKQAYLMKREAKWLSYKDKYPQGAKRKNLHYAQ